METARLRRIPRRRRLSPPRFCFSMIGSTRSRTRSALARADLSRRRWRSNSPARCRLHATDGASQERKRRGRRSSAVRHGSRRRFLAGPIDVGARSSPIGLFVPARDCEPPRPSPILLHRRSKSSHSSGAVSSSGFDHSQSNGAHVPQVVGAQAAIGRSRRIGSVRRCHADFGRGPLGALRSASLHCARPAARIPETA